jgi:hypothetical protein
MCTECEFCGQKHIVKVMAKCNDAFTIEKDGQTLDYIPKEIGRTDYIKFEYCSVCGKIQEK